MAEVHTWAGLILGWLLVFVFLTGTAGYFDTEIDRWMQPERPVAPQVEDTALALTHGVNYLTEHAADADSWFLRVPRDRTYSPWLFLSWSDDEGGGRAELDPNDGELVPSPRDTGGGLTLYRMHYVLHYLPERAGEWIVGVAAMFMLLALVTGVIVHRRIFGDFFTFRPGKRQRSWLDAHNALGVLSLPYQFMITYSGLVILAGVYMPLIIAAHYGMDDRGLPDHQTMHVETDPAGMVQVDPSGTPSPLVDMAELVARIDANWGPDAVHYLQFHQPGDASAVIVAGGDIASSPMWNSARLVFSGSMGELLAQQEAVSSPAIAITDVLRGLHEANFAGPLLRWMLFLSGVMGTGMIATGLVLWTVKRRQKIEKTRGTPHLGLKLVERLNVAVIIGLPIAIAAYFWANRLLPLDWPSRAEWEAHVMFMVWLGLLLHAGMRSTQRAWREQAILAAAGFGLLPVLNAVTTQRHLGVSLATGDWVFAGFDLAMLAIGSGFAALAWRLNRSCGNSSHRATGPAVASHDSKAAS
ncbi:MAG: PepSY-associated TM helix domain-containing protein [Phycisphaerae bacterium]